MSNIKLFLAFAIIFSVFESKAQDILDALDAEAENGPVLATFKSTRLINQHTTESLGKRTLDFRISHRFGPLNSGGDDLWGLDGPANIRLGLEYSPDGRFMFGLGRSSYDMMFDGFLKYRLLRQTEDDKMPLSLTLLSGAYYTAKEDQNIEANGYDKYSYTSSRLSYCFELMLARKFTPAFSLQIAPWFVHYNLVDNFADKNDVYGVAGLFRLKFSKRSAVTAEYAYRINDYSAETEYYDSFSIGYELETGGHVFQVHFTNSFGIVENQFFARTDSKWDNMGIRLGFNISRVFTL